MDPFESLTAEITKVVEDVWKTLNTLDVDALMAYFHDDAVTLDIEDHFPPTEGKENLAAFFRDFYEKAKNIHFELVGEPHVAGNFVVVRQIDHFELDGNQRHSHIVSVLYITDGKIKKWIGQILNH